jgi:NADP-dependent 3-hydroxy acid dehydrogenase YdfG
LHFAGILDRHQLDDVTIDIWDQVMNVNLRGTFLLIQALTPIVRGQKGGRIVFSLHLILLEWDRWLAVRHMRRQKVA